MGILDDAIREHLELKRKHGVAEEELQRQEEEALGPARRGVAQQHEDAEPTPGQTATLEDGDAAAPAALHDTALFDMQQDDAESPEPPAAAEATPAEPPPAEPTELEPDEDDLLAAEPEGEALDDQVLEDEDQEPEDEEPEDEEPEGEDADVLEDTPDFLQETPEHDRLWFEQKPPRDFDFD